MKISKKFILSLLIFSFIIPSIFFLKPKTAEAIFGVGDAVIVVADIPYEIKEGPFGLGGLDSIAWLFAKRILQDFLHSTAEFIRTGRGGESFFITDIKGFLRDAVDRGTGKALEDIFGSSICEPLKMSIRLSVARYYSSSYRERTRCTLSDIVQNILNPEVSFSITRGGGVDLRRVSWQEIATLSEPENNFYGQYFLGLEQVARRQQEERAASTLESSFGQGFLSMRPCVRSASILNESTGQNDIVCMEYGNITTPGKVISDQLERALGAEVGTLELADEFNEIIAAAANRLVSWAIGGGTSFSVGGDRSSGGLSGFRSRDSAGNYTSWNLTDQGALMNNVLNTLRGSTANYERVLALKEDSLERVDSLLEDLEILQPIVEGTTSPIALTLPEGTLEIGTTISIAIEPPPYYPIYGGAETFDLRACVREPVNDDITGEIARRQQQKANIQEDVDTLRAILGDFRNLENDWQSQIDINPANLGPLISTYAERSLRTFDLAEAQDANNNLRFDATTWQRYLTECLYGDPPPPLG